MASIVTEWIRIAISNSDYRIVDRSRMGTIMKGRASSYEKLKRGDNQYKYGIVVEYNTDTIVRGKGSAIFVLVVREPNRPTAGCIAIAVEDGVKKAVELIANDPVVCKLKK